MTFGNDGFILGGSLILLLTDTMNDFYTLQFFGLFSEQYYDEKSVDETTKSKLSQINSRKQNRFMKSAQQSLVNTTFLINNYLL